MLFFGKKSKALQPADNQPKVAVQVIPAEFYAGANPVIKFKTVEKEITLPTSSTLSALDKKRLDQATAIGAGQPRHPVNLLANSRFLLMTGGVLFVLFIAGAGAYYWRQINGARQQAQVLLPPAVSNVTTPPEVVVEPEATVEVATSTPEPTAPSLSEAPLEFPSRLWGNSADLDNDDVTDIGEELFLTDPGVPDTDDDKYADGHEIYNLYNPTGKEPMKLIASGLVKEFVNPAFGYKVYYPQNWALGNVDVGYRQMLFSTLTGENIEIRLFDKPVSQTFAEWFAQWAPNEQYSQLNEFNSVFKESGQRRDDYLVYYFPTDDKVAAIIYHTADVPAINYRIVVKMMARSFRWAGNQQVLPLPIVESATSTATTSAEIESSATSSSGGV